MKTINKILSLMIMVSVISSPLLLKSTGKINDTEIEDYQTSFMAMMEEEYDEKINPSYNENTETIEDTDVEDQSTSSKSTGSSKGSGSGSGSKDGDDDGNDEEGDENDKGDSEPDAQGEKEGGEQGSSVDIAGKEFKFESIESSGNLDNNGDDTKKSPGSGVPPIPPANEAPSSSESSESSSSSSQTSTSQSTTQQSTTSI